MKHATVSGATRHRHRQILRWLLVTSAVVLVVFLVILLFVISNTHIFTSRIRQSSSVLILPAVDAYLDSITKTFVEQSVGDFQVAVAWSLAHAAMTLVGIVLLMLAYRLIVEGLADRLIDPRDPWIKSYLALNDASGSKATRVFAWVSSTTVFMAAVVLAFAIAELEATFEQAAAIFTLIIVLIGLLLLGVEFLIDRAIGLFRHLALTSRRNQLRVLLWRFLRIATPIGFLWIGIFVIHHICIPTLVDDFNSWDTLRHERFGRFETDVLKEVETRNSAARVADVLSTIHKTYTVTPMYVAEYQEALDDLFQAARRAVGILFATLVVVYFWVPIIYLRSSRPWRYLGTVLIVAVLAERLVHYSFPVIFSLNVGTVGQYMTIVVAIFVGDMVFRLIEDRVGKTRLSAAVTLCGAITRAGRPCRRRVRREVRYCFRHRVSLPLRELLAVRRR